MKKVHPLLVLFASLFRKRDTREAVALESRTKNKLKMGATLAPNPYQNNMLFGTVNEEWWSFYNMHTICIILNGGDLVPLQGFWSRNHDVPKKRCGRSFPSFYSRKSCSPLVPPAFAFSPTDSPNKWLKRDLLKAVRECRCQQPGHSARPTPWPPLFRGHL